MTVPTQVHIEAALQLNNTNLCAWAKAHDYKYTTVFNTVQRWAGRNDRTPHGGIARLIMRDLAEYVEDTKCRHLSNEVATEVATKKTVSPLTTI